MTKHTPGPWTIEEYGDEDAPALVIHKDTETRVCFMATPGSHGDPARIEADAHLITAAPELLASCSDLLKMVEAAYRQLGMWAATNPRILRARDAIAKATPPTP